MPNIYTHTHTNTHKHTHSSGTKCFDFRSIHSVYTDILSISMTHGWVILPLQHVMWGQADPRCLNAVWWFSDSMCPCLDRQCTEFWAMIFKFNFCAYNLVCTVQKFSDIAVVFVETIHTEMLYLIWQLNIFTDQSYCRNYN